MNNDLIYTLDPVIIRIIFQVKTDDEALEVYNELANGVNTVYEETVREYLLENGFNEEDIQIILNSVEFENLPAKYKPYVQNVILLKKIENNTKLFLKTYYDQLLPKLSVEAKKSLEEYIKESEELIKARQEETRAGLQLMKKILEDNGVNNYDELKEKLANQQKSDEPKVNLGGIQTTNLPTAQIENKPAEAQPEPISEATPSIETVPVTPQPAEAANPVITPVEPVIQSPPVAESQSEVELEMPNLSEPTSPVPAPAENAPFDWNSLILEQIEANNDGSTGEAAPAPEVSPVSAPAETVAPVVEVTPEQVAPIVTPEVAPVEVVAPAEAVAPIAAPIVTEAPVVESTPEQKQLSAAALIDNLGISDNPPAMQSQPEQPVAPVGQPVNPQ